jgi:hypothetical protein
METFLYVYGMARSLSFEKEKEMKESLGYRVRIRKKFITKIKILSMK